MIIDFTPERNNIEIERVIKIEIAEEGDIEGILSVQNSVLIKNIEPDQAAKGGFLVYPITTEELRDVISDPRNIVLCAKDRNGRVIGYILAYDLNNWIKYKSGWIEKIKVSKQTKSFLIKKKTIYLRHIARISGYEGTGQQLLKYFLSLARARNVDYIICEILEKSPNYPKNKRSIKFFTNNNFKKVGSVIYEDSLCWGLYLFKL